MIVKQIPLSQAMQAWLRGWARADDLLEGLDASHPAYERLQAIKAAFDAGLEGMVTAESFGLAFDLIENSRPIDELIRSLHVAADRAGMACAFCCIHRGQGGPYLI
jgi:hypothetical protein